MSAQPPVRAYLMAAGLGTRLYPLTGLTSKPMVPILNRPVMEHLLHLLRRHGVTEIAANLHYHPDKIRSYFGDGSEFGVELRYNLEEHLLGTAGGADAFREFLSASTFLVMSGDGLTDIDLSAFLAAHRASGGVATMAVKEVDDPSLYGVVVHDDDMRVVGFQEKPPREEALSTLCNCGIYAFEPQIFDYIEPGVFVDWAKDVFPALLEDGQPFHCWELATYWNDVGNIEQYRLSNFDALLGRVALDVPGRQISPGVWVGQGTEIEAGVRLEAADPARAPAASSSPAPSSSARSSSATAASSSAARCSRASSSGTARRPAGTRAWPAASSVATSSCTTRPWCARTP